MAESRAKLQRHNKGNKKLAFFFSEECRRGVRDYSSDGDEHQAITWCASSIQN